MPTAPAANRSRDVLRFLLVAAALATASCAPSIPVRDEDAAATARRVAQEFVDGYYHQFPDEAYEVGYPDTPMDRLGDRGAGSMAAWREREDFWLATLARIDPVQLEGTDAAVPYAFTRDRLEASVARRVCRGELWNVSPTWTGWQSMLASTFAQQPVDDEAQRATALARLRVVPHYLDTEIENLRAGMAAGYLAPNSNVSAVLAQVGTMLDGMPDTSPFAEPASRSDDAAFQHDVRALVADAIYPAIRRYRDYLATAYRGRDGVGVSANPDGAACYAASVRSHTSLDLDPRAIHETGLREVQRIEDEMARIAREHFDTGDLKGLMQRLRTEPRYTFRSEADVLAYARAAVDRAQARVPDWFGFVPDARLVVKPFPAYQKASGGGFYAAGSVDGTRPGTYELGTYAPETISKAGMEATAFHESYPGHHLQMAVAIHGKGVHPVLRYVYVPASAEGWGLYSELLADEMGLYSSQVDRLGMLSNQAFRAARLVVDPGLHALGWTREQAIDYMVAHTTASRAHAQAEIDRYLATPGQATAYMTGSLEILRLRHEAERQLGSIFDIRGFHDVVIGDGAVTLPMLQDAVARWTQAQNESAAATLQRLIAADNARDLGAVLDAYTDDIVFVPPAGALVVGKAAVRDRYEALFRDYRPELESDVVESVESGDLAYVRGSNRGSLVPTTGGDAIIVDDQFLAILRRDAGHWRISRLIWVRLPQGPPSVDVRYQGEQRTFPSNYLNTLATRVGELATGSGFAARASDAQLSSDLVVVVHYSPPLQITLHTPAPLVFDADEISLYSDDGVNDGWPMLVASSNDASWSLAKYDGGLVLDLLCSGQLEPLASRTVTSNCKLAPGRTPLEAE